MPPASAPAPYQATVRYPGVPAASILKYAYPVCKLALSHASPLSCAKIKTTRLAGGLLFGYNPRKAGARLKTPAFTLFRPYCP